MESPINTFKNKILIIDDEYITIKVISEDLRDVNFELISAQTALAGLELAHLAHPDIILLDVIMPDISGFDLCRILKANDHTKTIPIIFLSVLSQHLDRIKGLDAGGVDFISKPFERDILLARIKAQLKQSACILDTAHHLKKSGWFGTIIGGSPAIKQVFQRIIQASGSDQTILICGETGTGKELAARLIFSLSRTNKKSFVPVNCGAIPENLCESLFFGYRKGAFTGAVRDVPGYLNQAEGGVLFLDEIAELSPVMQVKLLRFLEYDTFSPLGSTVERRANVRIIAATNRNLKQMIAEGKLREDFFHRINVITIFMPPLREHKEDIPSLIRYFLKQNSISDRTIIPDAVMQRFYDYDWHGNVRELFNELRRYMVTGEIEIGGSQLFPLITEIPSDGSPFHQLIENTEKRLIKDALLRTGHNIAKTSELLGMPLRTLHRKIKKYGL